MGPFSWSMNVGQGIGIAGHRTESNEGLASISIPFRGAAGMELLIPRTSGYMLIVKI
jgi:hypothetical protein